MALATALPTWRLGRPENARVHAAIVAHHDALWRFLRRMGIAESETEDAVQQVLLVFALRAWAVSPEAERSFLFNTALRVAADLRRKRHRTAEVAGEDAILTLPHPVPDAEHQLADQELRKLLDNLLEELSPKFRAVFVLAELEEMTMAAISELLHIPPGTVASRLRRARELFEAKAHALRARCESLQPNTETDR
jgi:RNA polymerase sigma-70 factor (ECF subfamily)